MEIKEVKNRRTERDFIQFPVTIYKTDHNWVRPLDIEMSGIFDPHKNVFFKHGTANRWVLKNNGDTLGRIAAFINYDAVNGDHLKTGGIGFFECIDDQEIASHLFDQCMQWLSGHGMNAMDGPINFGENNNYWGLLVDGFTQPAFGMNYNPAYYRKLFENYGFEKLYEQYTNHFHIEKSLPERFRKIVSRVFSRPNYRFEHFKFSQLDKFVGDIVSVYNKAWVFLDNFKELDFNYVKDQFLQMKAIIDEKMIWFVYAEDCPAGFVIAVPDVNQIIKKLDGKFGFWEKLKFLYFKNSGSIDRVRVVIMGVAPEYQHRGLESGLIVKLFDTVKATHRYREGELSWVGSFNQEMMAIHKASGATFGKKHITYRKVFE